MIESAVRVLFLTLVASATLPSQRETIEWQKRTTTIEYGTVSLGTHTLDELPVGNQWQMGTNQASTWNLQMPIVAGDAVLPPGQYRISLLRTAAKSCAVVALGSHHAVGSGSDVRVNGELAKAAKPNKKLTLEWAKPGAAAGGNEPTQIVVQFGDNEWRGAVTLTGGKNAALTGWKLAVFSLPVALVASRDKAAVPVATFTRGSGKAAENWNLMLGKDARLVPWMQLSPTDSGLGEGKAPDQDGITTGKVEAQDSQTETPGDFVDLKESSLLKGEFMLQLVAGKETLKVTVPEPKASKAR